MSYVYPGGINESIINKQIDYFFLDSYEKIKNFKKTELFNKDCIFLFVNENGRPRQFLFDKNNFYFYYYFIKIENQDNTEHVGLLYPKTFNLINLSSFLIEAINNYSFGKEIGASLYKKNLKNFDFELKEINEINSEFDISFKMIIKSEKNQFDNNYNNFGNNNSQELMINRNLKIEIENLKKEIQKKNQIIEQQNITILNLQNKLNDLTISSNNNQNLKNALLLKEKELNELKYKYNELNKLKSNNKVESDLNKEGGMSFAINFISDNQDFIYPMLCNSKDTVVKLEEELYNEYPQYKDYNTYLTANGIIVKRFKTIEENGIKKGNAIMVNIPNL